MLLSLSGLSKRPGRRPLLPRFLLRPISRLFYLVSALEGFRRHVLNPLRSGAIGELEDLVVAGAQLTLRQWQSNREGISKAPEKV